MSKTTSNHKSNSPTQVIISIITCSSSKYEDKIKGKVVNDPSGDLIEELLKKSGQIVYNRKLVPDDEMMIKNAVKEALFNEKVDSIIITGGTGIAPKDITIESLNDLLDKEIPGFGELFRRISFDEIGSAAIVTRALAGVAKGSLIFCLPGSPNAVEKAIERLIIPEIGHMVKHARGT